LRKHQKINILFRTPLRILVLISLGVISLVGCSSQQEVFSSSGEIWGIYQLDLTSEKVLILYGTDSEISGLSVDPDGERLVFSQKIGGTEYENSEIHTLLIKKQALTRLTENDHWDLYPVWSPDGSQIAYLSWRDTTLDIYLMNADGGNQRSLYDSGFHDADIDWIGEQIVFTSQSKIWIIKEDGSNPHPLTNPPRAGEWGQANLPFGDYDPRLSPDGSQVVFSRLVDDQSAHGNYDLFIMDIDGTSQKNLTGSGHTQGLSSWSPSGDKILYIISAIGGQGVYDLYSVNSDGSENRSLTPTYLPTDFLIHGARFAPDSSAVYFIGQWWIGDGQ
jgi:Tol biopolymer transport system component